MKSEILHWERTLELAMQQHATHAWLRRAVVLESCASTQDEAFARAEDTSDVCVVALRQLAGRGRLGRTWSHDGRHGLAITFALSADAHDAAALPLRCGLAALGACEHVLRDAGAQARCALRWPNDVVERVHTGGGRKLAGVLIERRGGVLAMGIGINVSHADADFPPELRRSAASLQVLALAQPPIDRLAVATQLIESLQHWLFAPRGDVARAWSQADVLLGTTQTFIHNALQYTGIVEAIDPDSHIELRLADDSRVRLPAISTSLVKDA